MSNIKYFITTSDGNNHQVSEGNINKYGIDSYAKSYEGATIRMRNNKGEDYHIPLSNYHDAVSQGLHAFRFDSKPDTTGQPAQAGSVARHVVAEYNAALKKNPPKQAPYTPDVPNSPTRTTNFEVQSGDYNNPANQWGEKQLADIERMSKRSTPKTGRPTTLNITDSRGRIHKVNASPISNEYMPSVPVHDNAELPDRINPNDKRFFSESDVQNANDNIRERQLNQLDSKANDLGHKAAGEVAKSMREGNPLTDALIFANTGGVVPSSNPDVIINEDAINAQAISNQVRDARELLNEHRQGNKNPLLRGVRGAKSAAKDVRTWDNGAQDLSDSKAILDAAKKYEDGTASSDQQDLLDVAAIKSSLEGDYGDEMGGMYGAGKNLVEMAPYMAKFIINPADGAGEASAKYVAKVGIEKFGKTAMKSLLGRIARTSARVAGDAASAAVITSAFDQGQIMADANKRMTGDIYSEKDQSGNVGYAGRGGQETSTGKAIGKAVTNDFEQNFGEMFGEYFSPVGKLLGKGVEKVASKIGLGKVSKMITDASNSEWVKGFNDFEKKAQWHGVLGEYGEEVATNMMNAATVGDNTWDTAPGTGVFNKDLNFDTFLGVALGAGFMSAFKSGQYATGKYSAKRELNASNSLAGSLIGQDKWEGLKDQIDNADDKDISGVMNNIVNDENLNDAQKKAAVQYSASLYRYHGANLQDVKSKMEGTITPQDEAFDKGTTLVDPQDRQNAKLSLDSQLENITSLFKDNDPRLLTWLQSDPQSAIQKMEDGGYDENTISIVSNYLNTKATYDGMIQGVRDEIDEKVDNNNATIASVTNQTDGLLHPATMRDGSQIYIVSGNVSLFDDGTIDSNNSDKSIIVRDPQTGEQKMISTNQLESIDQTINANDYNQQSEADIRNYYAQQASDQIEGVLPFNPGDTYNILDQNGTPQQVTIQQPVGDGVNVQLLDGSVVPMSEIQSANNSYNISQLQSENNPSSGFQQGDEIQLNLAGQDVNATISTQPDADGKYEVTLDKPVNGKYVLFMNDQDINNYLSQKQDNQAQEEDQNTVSEQPKQTDNVVRDEKGSPIYEQTPVEDTISDMTKQGADNNDILDYSNNMISELDKESKALEKKKPEFSKDFSTYRSNKQALSDQKAAVEKQKQYWQSVIDAITPKQDEPKDQKPISVVPKVQRNTGKYIKENKQMGDYLNLRDRVLRGIATGTKFLWNDDGIKKGLSTELGFKGSEGERRKRIGLISSKDKGGVSIDELAHNIWEEREGQPWQNDDVSDIKNEIISVLSDNNGTRSMIDEAMKMHEEPEEGDDSYEAQNYIAGLANSLHINPEDMREYDSYIDDKTKNYYESASDDELNSIFAEKFLADENEINNKEDGQRETGKIQEVRGQIPRGEESANGSTGGDNILQKEKSISEGSVRQGSERKSSKNDNVRPNEDGNNTLPNKSIPESGEDQFRPKLDQYKPISQAAKDKAKELDLDIEKQSNAVSKANKIVERKRDEISSRNGLFGDTKSTEIFNETSDLSNDNLHKALDKYIKDYDFEKNKLDDLLANRDKKLKDIDEAESKQVNMFTSETPEEANVKRMSDIEERLSDIDSLIMEHEDNNTSDALDMISLNKEKEDLESEYKGLKEINNESKNIQERKFSAPVIENESPLEYAQKVTEAHERFKEEQKTNTNPSEAQKEAGNYKKGHVKLDGYDITIENPKGSERSGKDADGKEWHTKMNNTYGYIRGTEGVDGDHIDVYLSDDPSKGDVYVVDQINPETGEFDEHKVMYGFPSALAARRAYLSNYEKGWKGLGKITKVGKDDFKKWIESSHRKTKPFNEYKSIKENRPKLIKEAKYDLMNARRELSVATSKNTPYTESEIEEKRRLVKEAEDHLKELLGNRKEDSESKGIRFSIKNKENFDKRYFEAINNGNMEEAQRIIDNAASLSEYSNLKDYEYAHKAPNSGGINKEDFRNLEKFRDVVDNGEEYPNLYVIGNGISSVPGDFFTPNGHRFYSEETPSDLESFRNIEKAIHNMKDQLSKYGEVKDIPMVRVYRAVPNSVKEGSVRNGGWVTPSKKYAEIHKENNLPGKGKIIEQDVPADQLWWDGNSINEWGYDDGNNYAYRDTKNNKKLLDVITKDDKGNIISPSKRFNIRNNDIRFNIKEKSDSQDTQLRDALIEKIRNSGIEVITDNEGQNILDKKLKESPEDGIKYSIREKPSPRETGIGYKVFVLKDGKLYPPMVANPNGEATPVGVWLDADAAPIAGESKTGRPQVKAGGKGTQGGSGKLAYRPGWHLGELPYAIQFNRKDSKTGDKELFPKNFVWAEVEYSKEKDYQSEAEKEGVNENGNYQHSLAGLKHVPEDGSYKYRTNPNPKTDEWVITGAMKVNKILSREDVDEIIRTTGREPQQIQEGDEVTQEAVDKFNKEIEGIKYYRTQNGEAYGFVKDGKVYIDTKIAGADTPIHEYTHLWSEVIRKENPEEWKNIVSLMKDLPIWDEVKKLYTNLKDEDGLAEEVLATYSGKRGAEKLNEEKERIMKNEPDIFTKAKMVDLFNRVKNAIEKFWHRVSDFLNIHYTTAEDVADQALKDLLNEVNPNSDNSLHSKIMDENYRGEEDNIPSGDNIDDRYEDDGKMLLTNRNIGPILYNMAGKYTRRMNKDGVLGMVVHDNKTNVYQAKRDYENAKWLNMYKDELNGILPRCTETAKDRVLRLINEIDRTLDYYKRQAEGEEMWRTEEPPMFSLVRNFAKPLITPQTVFQRGYDEQVNSTANKWRESYQDSMLGLKLLQQQVERESGSKIEDFENAYMAENQLSSKNRYLTEFYKDNFFNPMMSEVHSLLRQGASYQDINDYLIAKHGLERNQYLADKNEEELGIKDYSGLSSLFPESDDYISEAENFISSFEDKYDTKELWDKINKATKETLKRSFEGGLLSKENYDKISEMFEYYVPLRGWDKDVANDYYEYLTSEKQVFSPAVKKMNGRTSVADDPLATIGNMAESTILQAGRNQMKQKFLNMAMNHESSLLTVKNMWYVNHRTSENPDWQRDIPEIKPDATAEEIHDAIEEHESRMEELKQAGKATNNKGKILLKYHTTPKEVSEHVVIVKRDGKEYTIFVNGNPRAAQAINGLTDPDASNDSFFLKTVKRMNRQMSANFTSRNPAFVVSNLSRDLIFAGTAVSVKEPWKYARMYGRNIAMLAPQLKMWDLLRKSHNGTLNSSIEEERYFKEFLENGGETGYTNLHGTDEYKKMIERDILESKGKVDLGRIFGLKPESLTTSTTLGIVPAFRFIAKWTEFLNRSAEDTTRFATYMTSRQMGRSVTRSVSDAKEITVNFNKKGGNGHGAVFFRSIYLFFNPSIQGLQNVIHIAKNNHVKFSTALFSFTATGFLLPIFNEMLINAFGGGDDKDKYNNLPEWQRRNNFIFYCGNDHFVMVPLPIELRAFYGLGEMAYQMKNGNIENEDVAKSALAQMSDLMPVNLTGNNGDVLGNIMPDAFKPIYQSSVNVDYFGKPIYRKNEYNALMPEYTKAYSGTSKQLVKSAKFLNDISGGDEYTPGGLNINPATVEHYFEVYFGGIGVTVNQMGKSISALWDKDMRQTRNIPVLNRLLTTSDNKSNFGTVNEKFYKYMDEYELTKQRERGYKKEDNNGSIEYAKKIDFLENSPEYARMEVIDQYKKWLKGYQDNLKKAQEDNDDSTASDYKNMINETKAEMVNELDKIR